MTEFGEEQTLKEILESHGVVGPLEERIRKHLRDWIRGNLLSISYAETPPGYAAIKKVEDKLLCEVPSHTWRGGGDAA